MGSLTGLIVPGESRFSVSGRSMKKTEEGEVEVLFNFDWDNWAARVGSLDDGSVTIVRLFAHGTPGRLFGYDASYIGHILGQKIRQDGKIILVGATGVGVDGHGWNPSGGVAQGSIGWSRTRVTSHGALQVESTSWLHEGGVRGCAPSSTAGEAERAMEIVDPPFRDMPGLGDRRFDSNMARQLSEYIPHAFVQGYTGVSFSLGAILPFDFGDPRDRIGDRQVWRDGDPVDQNFADDRVAV